MIQFILVFLVVYFLCQFLVFAWPVVGSLLLVVAIVMVISRASRRRLTLRRNLMAIRSARNEASVELDRLQAETEAAMWEELRRHQ